MIDDTPPTVLIVDDDRINRTALATLLQPECNLLLAKSGASALQRLEEADVSLVLLDISMPDMDGYEVLSRIRADKRTADISVIFITGQTQEVDEERGLLLGADDYVSKPIRPAIVRARVRAHLRSAMQRRQLAALSMQDGLTGIANRRSLDEALHRACRNAARTGDPIGVVMLDVDHFKQFNDHYGHGVGDEALRRVARVAGEFARRPYDVAARYGGEEFCLLLVPPGDFPQRLEQLRHAVEALQIPHVLSPTASSVTVSVGGVIGPVPSAKAAQHLLQQADALLYRSKQQGRNRVSVASFSSASI